MLFNFNYDIIWKNDIYLGNVNNSYKKIILFFFLIAVNE